MNDYVNATVNDCSSDCVDDYANDLVNHYASDLVNETVNDSVRVGLNVTTLFLLFQVYVTERANRIRVVFDEPADAGIDTKARQMIA